VLWLLIEIPGSWINQHGWEGDKGKNWRNLFKDRRRLFLAEEQSAPSFFLPTRTFTLIIPVWASVISSDTPLVQVPASRLLGMHEQFLRIWNIGACSKRGGDYFRPSQKAASGDGRKSSPSAIPLSW
jgi:hypothetical protein